MSLLEKARGSGPGRSSPRTSLFSRALAAHAAVPVRPAAAPEPSPREPERVDSLQLGGLDELEKKIEALPLYFDSVLAAWSFASDAPLSALALFLPRGDFLAPAALHGFPSGTMDEIPMSFARSSQIGVEPLGDEARALLAPILGVPQSLSLRAATTVPESDFVGLWVYHDASLDASTYEARAKVGSFLARIGEALPPFSLSTPAADPVGTLLEASMKYPSASAFSFDLSSFSASSDPRLRGLEASAIRSSFLSSCLRMLSRGGAAIAFDEWSIACVLGSASPIDPGLALFQFKKTLRRILPFLAVGAFPEGRALGFDPSSKKAQREIASFLSK